MMRIIVALSVLIITVYEIHKGTGTVPQKPSVWMATIGWRMQRRYRHESGSWTRRPDLELQELIQYEDEARYRESEMTVEMLAETSK